MLNAPKWLARRGTSELSHFGTENKTILCNLVGANTYNLHGMCAGVYGKRGSLECLVMGQVTSWEVGFKSKVEGFLHSRRIAFLSHLKENETLIS